MKNDTKKQDKMGGVNPVAVAVTGAVVGAGLAVAGAVAMKDEKNRQKVKKVLNTVKDQAVNYMENMEQQANDKKGEVVKKLVEAKKK